MCPLVKVFAVSAPVVDHIKKDESALVETEVVYRKSLCDWLVVNPLKRIVQLGPDAEPMSVRLSLMLTSKTKSVNVAGIELKVIEDAALVSSCLAISCIFFPS